MDSITKTAEIVAEGEHLIGSFGAESEGPTLMVFGGIHGNETAGVRAARRVAVKLAALEDRRHGRIFLFAGNTRAMQKGVRFIHQDLNRHWTDANVTRNDPGSQLPPQFSEDREQMELLAAIVPILNSARGEVFALDLHSTSAEGVPFATVGDTMRNRRFATKLPVTFLLGIEEQLEGTLLEYLNNIGAVTMGFEGGQHYAESTVNTHESLVWLAIEAAGVIKKSDIPDADYHAQVVKKATGRPEILEIRYRHEITENDGFVMRPGYENFQPIRKGEYLADDLSGNIRASESGLILMPLYQKLGEDGFFIGRRVKQFWLWLSAILRWMRLGDLIHLLPGVHPTDADREVLRVDTTVARFFPLQVFHLLGFRKRRWTGESLTVSRRKHDIKSPFTNEG
ncbi:MAG: succinylglutamate desuccinylase/aspartoacylase family protein [Acidobacteria bacterium]|nr:succinylglutamate desuccinylase/aspartoacylase family protein [Acidobacteriota bacterium]